jgi:Xaa-Pro aminopeptidase
MNPRAQDLPEIRKRVAEVLDRHRAAALATTRPSEVTWLTGYAVPAESWPAPWDTPVAAIALRDGGMRLIRPRAYAGANVGEAFVPEVGYDTHGLRRPLDPHAAFAAALIDVLVAVGPGDPILLDSGFPVGAARLDGRPTIVREEPTLAARRRKTPTEVALVAENARGCDAFQAAVGAALAAGERSEVAVFAAGRAAVERDKRVTLLGDLVSGRRTAAAGGPPGPVFAQDGEAVLCDVSVSVNGYWADTCATHVAGRPERELRPAIEAVRRALRRGIEHCRPGVPADRLHREMADPLVALGYTIPHHSGHGIGAGYHEPPRIVPGADERIEEGMVLCLEPAAVIGRRLGVRLEVVGEVRGDGLAVLSTVW